MASPAILCTAFRGLLLSVASVWDVSLMQVPCTCSGPFACVIAVLLSTPCGPSFVRLPVFHDPSFACVCCIHLGVGRFLLVPPSKGHLLHVHPSRDPTRIGFEPIDFPLDPPIERPIGRGGMGMPRPQLHVQTHLEGVGRAWAHPEWDLHRGMANKRRPLCALPWTDATWKDGARTKERKDGT